MARAAVTADEAAIHFVAGRALRSRHLASSARLLGSLAIGDFEDCGLAAVRQHAVGGGQLSGDGMWCRLQAAYH
jgi:hypothetical protein